MTLYNEATLRDLARSLRKSRPETVIVQTTSPNPRRGYSPVHYKMLAEERDRAGQVINSKALYKGDGRYKAICKTLARDATKSGFTVSLSKPNRKAEQVINELIDRLKLRDRVDDFARLTFRDGDSFLELSFDEREAQIMGITRKPTLGMRRNSNDADKFEQPDRAYWYSNKPNQVAPPPDAIWFADYQMVHARWDHDEGERYGSPLMSSGRKAIKMTREGEEDVFIRRKTRAGQRIQHKIEGDETAIEEYIDRNQVALDDPFAPMIDYFGNAEIKVIAGDPNIGDIKDILHHLDTWWIESPVPKAILGYGRDLNRDVLQEQKAQYDESIEGVQRWIGAQFILPVIEIELLLNGILPEDLGLDLAWGNKKKVTTKDILNILQGAQIMKSLGLTNEILAQVIAKYIPFLNPKEIADALEQGDADRLAAIANQLGQALNNPNNPDEPDDENNQSDQPNEDDDE